jgi:hypothetical protein
MTGRADAGLAWMYGRAEYWSRATVVATHCWWHVALFHLAKGERDRALALYDERVRAGRSRAVSDLIDASALLWRIHLHGGDTGARWRELAAAWAPHVGDAFCTFSDLHAMIAFIGAGDRKHARDLERQLETRRTDLTRYGVTTREVGLPAGRGLIAFGRGNHPRAVALLRGLPAQAYCIGGSQAQRNLLNLTRSAAEDRLGAPFSLAPSRAAAGPGRRLAAYALPRVFAACRVQGRDRSAQRKAATTRLVTA